MNEYKRKGEARATLICNSRVPGKVGGGAGSAFAAQLSLRVSGRQAQIHQ